MYRRVIRSARPASVRRARLWVPAVLGALLLCVEPNDARAQSATTGTISGAVVDDSTGAALPRVTVLVVEPTRGTLTDDRGRFVITGVPAGSRVLRARALSYRQRDVPVAVRAGDTTEVTIRLASAPVTLGAVRARARPPERDRFELAPNVGTVSLTPSAVSGVPAIGEPDVLRTVQLLPGVNARNDFSSG
jgi:hypothetical protein